MTNTAQVGILMGSDSDWPKIQGVKAALDEAVQILALADKTLEKLVALKQIADKIASKDASFQKTLQSQA